MGLKKAGRSVNPELWRRLACGLLSAADVAEVSWARAPNCLPRCPSLCSGCGRSQRTRPPQALPPPRHPAAIGAPPPAGGTTCAPTAAQTETESKNLSEVYFTSQQPGSFIKLLIKSGELRAAHKPTDVMTQNVFLASSNFCNAKHCFTCC